MLRSSAGSSCFLSCLLGLAGLLLLHGAVHAHEGQARTGSVILRMCKSADQVKALSVMCHSYLDGHIDASLYLGKGRFCLGNTERKQVSATVVAWVERHPESLDLAAAEVLQRALTETYPCKGQRAPAP